MVTRSEINLVRSLSDTGARRETGLFVVEGAKSVAEVAASGLRIRKIYTVSDDISVFPGIDTRRVAPKDMERMSHLRTPPAILALVEIPRHEVDPADFGRELTLALDGVQDPGNLGTIIRLADWFGVRDVLCSRDSADCFNPKVVQATMGAITRVRVHYGDLREWLAASGVPVFGTFLDGGNIYTAPLSPSGIIVMGSEGSGIGPQVGKLVTIRLTIPSFPLTASTSESLNVATATAITLSEFRRRIR